MEIEDLENLIKRDEEIKDNLNIINNIYKNIYKYNKKETFKNELKKLELIEKNKELFKWIFNDKERENESEEKN